MSSVLLYQRLVASQTADDATTALSSAIETAISDLGRINRGLIYARNPPGEFTRRKLQAIASRLLQAATAPEIAATVEE